MRNRSKPITEGTPQDEVFVELFIQIDGSAVQNKITTFKLPIRNLNVGDANSAGSVELETEVLVRAIKQAVDKLL